MLRPASTSISCARVKQVHRWVVPDKVLEGFRAVVRALGSSGIEEEFVPTTRTGSRVGNRDGEVTRHASGKHSGARRV